MDGGREAVLIKVLIPTAHQAALIRVLDGGDLELQGEQRLAPTSLRLLPGQMQVWSLIYLSPRRGDDEELKVGPKFSDLGEKSLMIKVTPEEHLSGEAMRFCVHSPVRGCAHITVGYMHREQCRCPIETTYLCLAVRELKLGTDICAFEVRATCQGRQSKEEEA